MKKFNAGRPLLTWATILTVLATAGSILSGCSLKPVDQHVMRIQLPARSIERLNAERFAAVANTVAATAPVSPASIPASSAEFKCFAINVTGPGIDPDPKHQCKDPNEYVGILAGFVSINQDGTTELSVTVPSGVDRQVQLIALTSADGTCGSVENERDMNNTGEPFIVGQASLDLFGDATVEIEASYNSATAKPAFQSCDGGSNEGFVPIAKAVKGFSRPIGEGETSPVDLVNSEALTSAEIEGITNVESNVDPLPVFSASNSAVFSGSRIFDGEYKYPAIQLRWDVSNMNSSVIDLQLQVGFDFSDVGCGGAQIGLQGVLLTDSGAKLGEFINYGYSQHTRNLRWSSFYRTFGDHTLTVDGKKMIVLNVYAKFDDYGACIAELAIGAAHLRAPTVLPNLRIESDREVLIAGRNERIGAYGGLPPYDFASSTIGAIAENVRYVGFTPGTGGEETISVYDSAGSSTNKTFGIARFKTLGPTSLVPGCNASPITFELQSGAIAISPSRDERIFLQSSPGFFVQFYSSPTCVTGTQVSDTKIVAGASASQEVYANVIAAFGKDLEIFGVVDNGGIVDPLSLSYSDVSCVAPLGVLVQSSAGGSTPCDALKKAQSFVPDQNMRVSSISLRNAIEMWPYGSAPSAVNVKIYSDLSGSPSGMVVNGSSSCTAPTGFFDSECLATFTTPPELMQGVKYWIVIWHSSSQQFCWQGSTFDSYATGSAKVYTGASWAVAPVSDFMFQINACSVY